MPHLEITEEVLINCNIVNNSYQQESRLLYTFVSNEAFGQLLDISHKKFTDHNFKPIDIEDKTNITLVIN